MKIRTKTKERLLSEGWYVIGDVIKRDDVDWVIPEKMIELLGQILDATAVKGGYYRYDGWTWTPEMIETKEEQVLRILKEYENRRQGGN